jgi:hypothetical protein
MVYHYAGSGQSYQFHVRSLSEMSLHAVNTDMRIRLQNVMSFTYMDMSEGKRDNG